MTAEYKCSGPLDGLLVVDLTRVLAGPYLTMMLADMGARVIKVENPNGGDDARHFGPFVDGESAYFATVNRGKESIALDLKETADRRTFESLASRADVLVENFSAGTMERLGYSWPNLQKLNSRLIYAAVSGFGHTGPYSDRPAYDLVVQGMGGIMSLTGTDDTPPMRVGTSIGDIGAGMFGLSGVLAALYERETSGLGCKVDVGMLDCQVAMLENAISRYFAENKIPGPMGLRHPSITPFAGLRAKNDEYFILAAGNDALFIRLCDTINRADIADDARFSSNLLRTQNFQALHDELERTFASESAAHWLALLQNSHIPCGPINDIGQVVTDPQVLARNMIVRAHSETGTEFRMPGNPVKFSRYGDSPARIAAPRLDAHREQVLKLVEDAVQETGADVPRR